MEWKYTSDNSLRVVDVLGNVTKDSDGDPIFGGIFAQMFRNDGNLF